MEKIIAELSIKYNLPKIVIETVIKSMFEFTAEVIKKGDLENVVLLHLGKFCTKPGYKHFLKRRDKAKDFLDNKEKELDGAFEEFIRDGGGIHKLGIPFRRSKEVIREET